MSFGLPSLRAGVEERPDVGFHNNSFGVHDSFSFGFRNTKSALEPNHPLETSERNFEINEQKMQMTILRNTQGMCAPIKLASELWAVKQVGRLPFLESSNPALATLKCKDDSIDFTDVLNIPEVDEHLYNPHIVMEHKLGIL